MGEPVDTWLTELRRRGHDVGESYVDDRGLMHVVIDDKALTFPEIRAVYKQQVPRAAWVETGTLASSQEQAPGTQEHENGCSRCRAHEPAALEKVGDAERNTYFDGKALEVITRYRCKDCGAEWTHYRESGVGGHGSSWSMN